MDEVKHGHAVSEPDRTDESSDCHNEVGFEMRCLIDYTAGHDEMPGTVIVRNE